MITIFNRCLCNLNKKHYYKKSIYVTFWSEGMTLNYSYCQQHLVKYFVKYIPSKSVRVDPSSDSGYYFDIIT